MRTIKKFQTKRFRLGMKIIRLKFQLDNLNSEVEQRVKILKHELEDMQDILKIKKSS